MKGAYGIWYETPTNEFKCLKVGIATGKGGLGKRICDHLISNPRSSVLAKHLSQDEDILRERKIDLKTAEGRRQFLKEFCYLKIVSLADTSDKEVRSFERFLEQELEPRYVRRVKRRQSSPDS